MITSKNFKYRYDEQDGIFIREGEISLNWLLGQVLGKDVQITKVDNPEILRFLTLIAESDLIMPDGRRCIYWLKDKLKEYHEMSKVKTSKTWEDICDKYRWILEQVDFFIVKYNFKDEKLIYNQIPIKINRTPNTLNASFEPLNESSNNI